MPFITALLVLTSCEFLNKKTTEKAVPSKRKIASLNPYQNPSRNQISVSNKAVSAVVLVKDKKPICTLSAAKAPHLVSKHLKVDPRRNTLDLKLPQCRQQEASMIRSTMEEAIVLDKYGGYRTAGPPVIGVAAWCLLGASLSLAIGDPAELRRHHKDTKSFRHGGAGAGGLYFVGEIVDNYLKSLGSIAKGLGIAGLCNVGTTTALYLFAE